jgi:hypothetical protein
MTLYEAEFSVPLFVAAVRSAVPLLSFFHVSRRHVHGDVSPHNALIVAGGGNGGGSGGGGSSGGGSGSGSSDGDPAAVVLWNDFGGSVPIGQPPMCLTAAFASMSFAPDRDAVRMAAQDDWEALFFTLLHFSYADPKQRRRHLPWESLSDALLWIQKTRCVSLPSRDAVTHVHHAVREFMCEWHAVLFHSASGVDTAAATVALLSKFVAQSVSDTKVAAPVVAPASGKSSGAPTDAVMVWIAPVRPTVYHATNNAHKTPKKSIPLAEALRRQLSACKKGCYCDE